LQKSLLENGKLFYFCAAQGEMAEWSIAAVLKTVELKGSGGSNPSLSAKLNPAKDESFIKFFIQAGEIRVR